MKGDILKRLKITVVVFVLLSGAFSYGHTFSYSNLVTTDKTHSVLHTDSKKINAEDSITYLALYKRDDSSFCILNPNNYQSTIKNLKLIQFVEENSLICSPSDEDVIHRITYARTEQGIGVIAGDNGHYLTVSVETLPVNQFESVLWPIPFIVGGMMVSRIPPDTWAKLAGSAAVLIEVIRQLAINKDFLFFPLPRERVMDRGHHFSDGTHLMEDGIDEEDYEEDDFDKLAHLNNAWDLTAYQDVYKVLEEIKKAELGGGELTPEEIAELQEESIRAADELLIDLWQLYQSWKSGKGNLEEVLKLNPELKALLKLGLHHDLPGEFEHPDDLSF